MTVGPDTLIDGRNCKTLIGTVEDFFGEDIIVKDYIFQTGDTIFYYNTLIEEFAVLYNFR